MRKIIQIACTTFPNAEGPNGGYYAFARTYALCDDGSLWWKGSHRDEVWRRCKDIPQDDPPLDSAR